MYLTTKTGRKILLNTEAEEAAINAGIAADPDTFEVTAAQMKKMRGRPSGSNKTLVHIRLDNDFENMPIAGREVL